MPKSSSPDLFRLIKSMSKAEKAFFTLQKTKAEQENYQFIRLFKLIDEQVVYNETAITKALKISRAQMARSKNYLYESLLDSISQTNADEPVVELRKLLNQVDVLFRKRLFTGCEKKLTKALALAKQSELFTSYAEISNKLIQLKELQGDTTWLSGNSKKQLLEEDKNLEKLKQLQLLKRYKHERLFLLHTLYGHDDSLKKEYGAGESLVEEINNLKHAASSSKTAQLNYYNYLCFIKYVFKQNKEAVGISRKALALFKNDEPFTKQNSIQYLHIINNLLLIGKSFIKPAEVEQLLQLLKKCAVDFEKTDYIRTNAFSRYYYFLLQYLFDNKKTEQIKPALEQSCAWLNEHNEQLVDQFNYTKGIEFLISSGCLMIKDYKQSIDYSQRVINLKLLNYDYHVARINFMIAHYELQNFEVLESIIRSLERHYKKPHPFQATGLCICGYLKKIIRATEKRTRQNLFKEMLSELKAIHSNSPTSQQLLNFEHKSAFLFEQWCQSKIDS